MKQKRFEIISLNFLKGICCIAVILLHCSIPGRIGRVIVDFLRFPVPCFFMISGYFSKNTKEFYKSKVIVTVKYLIFGETFSMAIFAIFRPDIYADQVQKITSLSLLKMMETIFSGTFFNGTLWYLYAALWSWIFLYVFSERKYTLKIEALTIFILLNIQIVGGIYFQKQSQIDQIIWCFRSAILYGIPFILIGQNIRKYEKEILNFLSLNRLYLFLGFMVCIAVLEYKILKVYTDVYLSTVGISIALFTLALHYKKAIVNKSVYYIGKELSGNVYLIHYPCILFCERYVGGGTYGKVAGALLLSVGLAWCIKYVLRALKNREVIR